MVMLMAFMWQINDGAQAKMYQCCWNFPGNDVSGMVASSEKYAGTCEKVSVGILDDQGSIQTTFSFHVIQDLVDAQRVEIMRTTAR